MDKGTTVMKAQIAINKLWEKAYQEGVKAGKKSVLNDISKLLGNSPKVAVAKKVVAPRQQSSLSPAQKAVQTRNMNRVIGQKKWWNNATPEQRAARVSARWGNKCVVNASS